MEKYPQLAGEAKEYEMTREELIENFWKKLKLINEVENGKWILEGSQHLRRVSQWDAFAQSINPLQPHFTMYKLALKYFGNDEQEKYWLPKADYMNHIGCYAQTELGHGSDVQGMETTATLDKQTDEFIIHTPTITATKFWPGSLGVSATHAVVFAKMIIDG